MQTSLHTDVLIVGAGPTGLMAANQLSRFAVDFILIDSKSGPTRESRAISVTPRSLEIYQQMGLSDKVLEQGTRINSFSIYSKGRLKAVVNIGEIGKGKSEFSYLFAFEQNKNEELLFQNLQHQGKDVLWETEYVGMSATNARIVAEVVHKGSPISIIARYLVGCDGAGSLIRHQLNFDFKGGTYENRFFVADTKLKWKEGYDKLIIAPGNHNFCGFFPLLGDGSYRVLGTIPDDARDRKEIPFSLIEKVVKEIMNIEMTFEEVNWFSIYKLHHRCVSTFSKGRVFLAGDSAHIHSPAGGQGMNTGLQDAYNLAWKLAFVLKKWAGPGILDTYNEERLPFARWLMKFTDRAFQVMTSDSWWMVQFRNKIMLNIAGSLVGLPWLRPIMFNTLSQIWYSYSGKSLSLQQSNQSLKFKAGDRLPYFLKGNPPRSVYEDFTSASFHLLHLYEPKHDPSVAVNLAALFPFPVKRVDHSIHEGWSQWGVKRELFILVRPDNYIAWVDDYLTEVLVKKRLKIYFQN
jgi:2-polyprenyl-6-methoxyphenol hydroxylase-like FAD-dependent oxidoreductase